MSLIIPVPDWRSCSNNLTATPHNLNYGTALTAGANNADGSAVQLLSALSHDVELIGVAATTFGTATTVPSALMDLLYDPAGGSSWAELIPDLMIGGTAQINMISTTMGNGMPVWYWFPIWVPAGASIGAMARGAHSSTVTGRVIIYALGGNRNPGSWWCGRRVNPVGINAAASQGTSHTPGTGGSYSSWASLGAPLDTDGYAYQWAIQGELDNDWSNTGPPFHWQFGYDSTQVGPTMVKGINANETGMTFPAAPFFHRFAAGTQLQVRSTSFGSSPQPQDVCAYIVS